MICTPNAFHASQAQAALRAGKDVLVQKPLALTYSDARETVDVARLLDSAYGGLVRLVDGAQADTTGGRSGCCRSCVAKRLPERDNVAKEDFNDTARH